MSLEPLHRPILFSEPDRAVWPPSWIGHIPFAFWIVEALRPETLVELGTHTGNSFSAFCQAVGTLGLPTRCFAIDTWTGDPQAGYYGDAVYDELAPYLQSQYPSARLLRMTFDEALPDFADGSVDLLHIDGFHSYEAVLHDFTTWLPKLSRRGVVLFHDVTVRLEGYEVWKFWDEVSRQYPSFIFAHSNGLGVLLVGAEVPAAVRWLVDATDGREEIRQFFGCLGHRLVSVYNDQEQRRLIDRQQRLIEDNVKTHYQETENRDREIHRLNGVVATASEDLIALGRMVNDRDAELARQDAEIRELNTAVQTVRAETAAVRDELAGRESEIARLDSALGLARSQIAAVHDQLVGRDALTSTLKAPAPVARGLRTRLRRLVRATGRRLLEVLPGSLTTRIRWRWQEGVIRSSGLFDGAFYLETCPEAALSGLDPLVHYLRHGAANPGGRLHPLFDPVFYLESYPEVRAAGLNPLIHYLRHGAAEGRRPHPLFDPAFYLESHPEVGAAGFNPLVHYLRHGAAEGCRPHPLFDPAFYLESHPEVGAAGLNPLVHYLRHGAAEGRWPNPLFDPAFYLEGHPEVRTAGLNPLVHYLRCGAAEGRRPHPLFDPAFYLESYPEVGAAGLDPLGHYLRHGAAERRWPNPLFNPAFYLAGCPEVGAAGLNPLVHYLRRGAAEGRRPHPLFDPAFYLESYPEVGAAGLNPLVHYLRQGAAEGRRPHPLFDPAFYLESCPEVGAAGLNPLVHYLRRGAAEGRWPHPLFDPAFYLESCPEVDAAGLNPLVHYLRQGAAEGRWPNPLFDPAFYLESCPEVGAVGLNPLIHYLRHGAAEGRWPNPLFDPAFYLKTYPDVQAAGMAPLVHYLRHGAAQGRWPNPLFDGVFYLESHPEVAAAGLNPLHHYLRYGAALGYRTNLLFDPAFYLESYPDVSAAGMAPLVHYLRHGTAEGRRPNPLFDGAWYLEYYPEVKAAGLNPLYHYLRWGAAEGRWSSRQFHGGFYLETYPEVAAAGLNPLCHYLGQGAAEGRRTRRSRRCDLRPQSRPMLPDPAAAPALLPFAVPAPAPGRETAVSIVIPVRTGGLTEGLTCLYRLGRRPPARPVQVIAVFPEGDADTAGALARVDGLVLAPVPAGTATAAACNHGAGRADGTRLVFLSPDVLVEAGWLDELVWSLDRLPEAGLVGALVVGADGWIEAEGGTLRRDGSVTLEGRGCDPALPEHGHARTVCWCPAGALIITATLFRRLGGFETACWAAARPELALAVAVRVAGLKVYCQSTARVVRLPAGDAAPRPNTLWPAAIRVPRTDPRWAALLDRSPAPALPEIEQERALGRRHLLVIDRALPVIDREPSGLAALMLLFFGLGYRVTFATPALPRDHGPEVRALERRGIHVLRQQADISVLSFLGRDEIAIDLLLFAHPGVAALFLPEIAELAAARMLAAAGLATDSRGRRLFVPEVVGLPTASSRVLLAGGLELPGLDLPEAGRDGWHQGRAGLALLREMVLTVVGNETERDALRQAAPDCPTLVMPPVIPVPDAGAGAPTGFAGPDISVGFADRHDLILPGRFEEWPDGEAVVAFVLDEWPQLRARLPGARLVILAMDTTVPPVIRALQSAEILVREGLDQAGAVLAGARLAVAPHRSWCGFHPAVAAVLARGVPAVLSPSVARGLGLAVDGSERVAEPGTAFVDRVAAVWDDQSLLARLAADGVRQATASWSAGAVRQRLIQLLHRARLTPTYDMSEQIARQALAAKGTLG